jgi:hypothetical protein
MKVSQVVGEGLARDEDQGEAGQQRDGDDQEDLAPADASSDPGVAQVVRDVADQRAGDRFQQPRQAQDQAGLDRRQAAEGDEEIGQPAGDHRLRAGPQHVAGTPAPIVDPGGFAKFRRRHLRIIPE